jgi:hypothetical protein
MASNNSQHHHAELPNAVANRKTGSNIFAIEKKLGN